MDQPPTKDATLSPVTAHNAVAAMTSLYAGIIADYERNQTFLILQVNQLRAKVKEQQDTIDAAISSKGATG
jgi:hypothetical protein